ncbi:MAG: hypothetical protein US50_C0001G0007 [Candidatus Nomurabacteria bacterium GW2011_GWB1_37_5]|uniref:Uncharacterized protein n=1 Tax=Candidatus Nomurabacteria bacterium GW2011_GWB1_37_5 TaxID=1618742 RepID=A0A0G0HBR7_9BACT|nr:MAG: hypothetical protein US50_C0001G0007 [Candidatus Nomurabacteria bacterium GW2011_GWB1_37_5]
MYKLVFREKRILPDFLWLMMKEKFIKNPIVAEIRNEGEAPIRKRDENGKLIKCVTSACCCTCGGGIWMLTMPEAARYALIGQFEMPKKMTLFSHRIYANFCDNCQKPGLVPKAEIVPYLEYEDMTFPEKLHS